MADTPRQLSESEASILIELAAGRTMSLHGFHGVTDWRWDDDNAVVDRKALGALCEKGLAASHVTQIITEEGREAIQSGCPCCEIGCPLAAEFAIYGESGQSDDDTYACERHVGRLLGTPAGLGAENRKWTVVTFTVPTRAWTAPTDPGPIHLEPQTKMPPRLPERQS